MTMESTTVRTEMINKQKMYRIINGMDSADLGSMPDMILINTARARRTVIPGG